MNSPAATMGGKLTPLFVPLPRCFLRYALSLPHMWRVVAARELLLLLRNKAFFIAGAVQVRARWRGRDGGGMKRKH